MHQFLLCFFMASIIGYGTYIPHYRIKIDEIARVWNDDADSIKKGLNISEKSVPDIDEDSATMAVEAARRSILHSGISSGEVGAIYVGSESHPYAVKPTAALVAQAISAGPALTAADLEFACKAGTAGMQMLMGMADSGMIKYGITIGSDTAQGRPGDALEYTASAGAAAFIIGKNGKESIAEIISTASYTTDTPDFWRREGASFPSHGGRFTGEPAYFRHVINATKLIFEKTGLNASDFKYAVFHQPNGKFPLLAAKSLGFSDEQVRDGLLTPIIGNTYSAASLLGLAAVLDKAMPGDKILLTSFGSGAGSDSFAMEVRDGIAAKRGRNEGIEHMLNANREYVDYAVYLKNRNSIKR